METVNTLSRDVNIFQRLLFLIFIFLMVTVRGNAPGSNTGNKNSTRETAINMDEDRDIHHQASDLEG
jgi:hypothetical protein